MDPLLIKPPCPRCNVPVNQPVPLFGAADILAMLPGPACGSPTPCEYTSRHIAHCVLCGFRSDIEVRGWFTVGAPDRHRVIVQLSQ